MGGSAIHRKSIGCQNESNREEVFLGTRVGALACKKSIGCQIESNQEEVFLCTRVGALARCMAENNNTLSLDSPPSAK